MKFNDSYPNYHQRRTALSHTLILKMKMMCADGVVMSFLPIFHSIQIDCIGSYAVSTIFQPYNGGDY